MCAPVDKRRPPTRQTGLAAATAATPKQNDKGPMTAALHLESGPMLAALDGARRAVPPMWMMRQAGRYLPEYREIRAKASGFLDFCFTPKLAVEATLQPIRRFGFDAAILFSDILVMPEALGQKVGFVEGEGPRLPPLEGAQGVAALRDEPDWDRLAPVFETVSQVRAALSRETALIGFCGAPWTVASYMIAGHGTPEQAPARLFAFREPETFQRLIDLLTEGSAAYLVRQLDAGADAVQIFDSWAGVLPGDEFRRWCLEPVRAIVARVRKARPGARIIAFPRLAGSRIAQFADVEGLSAVGLDTAADPAFAARALPAHLALQGNLDPLALMAGGARLDAAVDEVLRGFSGRTHIFNLGHGILPTTPIPHVEQLVKRVRGR